MKTITYILGTLIFCLGLGCILLYNDNGKLKEENARQADIIKVQEAENKQLVNILETERAATIAQSEAEKKENDGKNEDVKIIYKHLSSDACSRAKLGNIIIGRLHKQLGE